MDAEKEKKLAEKRKARTTNWDEYKHEDSPYSREARLDNLFDKRTQEVLLDLEKTQNDFWNVARSTGNFLNMLIRLSRSKNVVEVGTSNGYSGIWIANALKANHGHLTTIEFYEKRIELAQENYKDCGLDDIITVKQGSAVDVLKELASQEDFICDFLFIDANKREYVDYFNIMDSKISRGGIIAADNVISHAQKVVPFVEALQNNPNYQVEVLDLPAGLLLANKISA